jgi:hypothetical protein
VYKFYFIELLPAGMKGYNGLPHENFVSLLFVKYECSWVMILGARRVETLNGERQGKRRTEEDKYRQQKSHGNPSVAMK